MKMKISLALLASTLAAVQANIFAASESTNTCSSASAGTMCMCGSCSDLCGAGDVDPVAACGAGCQWEGDDPDPGLFAVPQVYKLQICDVDEILVRFRLCGGLVPFKNIGDGIFLITQPTDIADIVQYQCFGQTGRSVLLPFIDISFDGKEIRMNAECENELYIGQLFGDNGEIQLVGSCIEGSNDCNVIIPQPSCEGESGVASPVLGLRPRAVWW